jgi:hypothetical protein
MVTHINFAVDDAVAERAREIKEEKDLSWPEFLEVATEEMSNGE